MRQRGRRNPQIGQRAKDSCYAWKIKEANGRRLVGNQEKVTGLKAGH